MTLSLSLSLNVFEMWPVMFLFNVIHFAHTHTYIHVQYVFRVHVCVIIFCLFIYPSLWNIKMAKKEILLSGPRQLCVSHQSCIGTNIHTICPT